MTILMIAFQVMGILISIGHGVLSYDIKKQNERMHEERMAQICYEQHLEDNDDLLYQSKQVELEDFDM